MKINNFISALFAVTLYWFLMHALKVESGSILKISLTSLLWLVVLIFAIHYNQSIRIMNIYFNRRGLILMNLLLVVNIINIGRGLVDTSGLALTNILGNPFTALSLLTPLAAAYAVNIKNIFYMNKYLLFIVPLGLISAILYFFISGFGVIRKDVSPAWNFIYPVIFLIGTIGYLHSINRYVIIVASTFLFIYIGVIIGSRATLLRIIFLYIFLNVAYWQHKFITKRVLPFFIMTILIIPAIFINSSLLNEESIFQTTTSRIQEHLGHTNRGNVLAKADTRTFLYYEVINDLIKDESLIFGKGSSGRYFSNYFSNTGQDTDTRLTVEVGFLAILLKGGIVAAVINIVIFIYAGVLAVTKSNNIYIKWIGFMILIHTLLLFVENLVTFDLYNIFIWFFVGACFSKGLSSMNDHEMKLLLIGRYATVQKIN